MLCTLKQKKKKVTKAGKGGKKYSGQHYRSRMDETLVKWRENSCVLKPLTTGGANFAAVWPAVASRSATLQRRNSVT